MSCVMLYNVQSKVNNLRNANSNIYYIKIYIKERRAYFRGVL